MSSSASLDDLPWEMINELCKHLQPRDLIACSMVNKRWHSIYTDFKLERLVVISDDYYLEFSKWSYPDQKIEQKELCPMEWFGRLADRPLLSNLKHLALCANGIRFDFNMLNRFSQLVHLEIEGSLGKEKVNLNLPELEVLAVHPFNDYCPLSIDCPELSVLVYHGEPTAKSLFDVKHPEKIRKLETNMVGPQLTRFKSVECLVTRDFEVISKATLQSLPRLKALHYNEQIGWTFVGVGIYARMKRTLREFLDEVELLRGPDFKFTFAGFQLTPTMLDEIDFGVQIVECKEGECEEVSGEYVYLKHYQLIDQGALHFIDTVYYDRLMNNVVGELPDCFSKKFTRVENVEAGAVQNETHFLRFLSSLSWLSDLCLEKLELSQAFYDQLPASAHSLAKLKLGRRFNQFDENREKKLELNFDFIDKLPRLSYLFICQSVSFESLASLVRWLGQLESAFFCFRLKENEFEISNHRNPKVWKIFEKTRRYQTVFETKNPDEILNYFQALKSDTPKGGQASD